MNKLILINNLNCNKINNLSLEINSKGIYSIIGKNGCGKTLLFNILNGSIEYNGDIIIFEKKLKNNIKFIRENCSFLTEDSNNMFINDNIRKEIEFILKNLGLNNQQILAKMIKIIKDFKIDNLIDKNFNELSGGEIRFISIILCLLKEPKVLFLDSPFDMLDSLEKNKAISLIKKISKSIPVIIFDNKLDDILYSKKIFIMNNGTIVLSGNKDKIFSSLNQLKDSGIKLPILAELSNKLSYYELVDDIILDADKLVNALWK